MVLIKDGELTRPAGSSIPLSPMQRFRGLLLSNSSSLYEAFVLALVVTLLAITTSYFIQHLVDNVLVRNEYGLLKALGIGMSLVLLFRLLLDMVRQYLLAHVGRKIDLKLMGGYVDHLTMLPLREFESRRVGDFISRLHDASNIREAASGTTLTAFVDSALILVTLAILWLYDRPLAAVATVFIPILLLTVALIRSPAKRRIRRVMEQNALLSSQLVENVTNIEAIKDCGTQEIRNEEAEQKLVAMVKSEFGLQLFGIGMQSMNTLVNGAAHLSILWYGGLRVMQGAITIGELMFFYSMLERLLGPLQRLSAAVIEFEEGITALDRLYQILGLPAEVHSSTEKIEFQKLQSSIKFEDVSFSYGFRGHVLREITLDIPVGRTIAIAGESGSGKTTLLNLMRGLLEPGEGRITFDGIDVRDIDPASLRQRIGVVAQDPAIFNQTVTYNVSLNRPGIGLDQVIEAVRLAGLEQFINELPERFDTMIGERGVDLSGGQKQRLAIARALVGNPDLIILDEATSHLDTETERVIQETLHTALAGRTVVLVAHRPRTIREADYVFVLSRGRIEQSGTHDELLRTSEWYSRLWQERHARPGADPANGVLPEVLPAYSESEAADTL
jgi:ATP-binding cassette subfamily B protein